MSDWRGLYTLYSGPSFAVASESLSSQFLVPATMPTPCCHASAPPRCVRIPPEQTKFGGSSDEEERTKVLLDDKMGHMTCFKPMAITVWFPLILTCPDEAAGMLEDTLGESDAEAPMAASD
ncbi:hypothetical protein STEG23_032323 [Scotinomys teguina]